MEYTLDCSLKRQDNLTLEKGNTGVQCREVDTWTRVEQIRKREQSNTPVAQDQVGNRHTGTSKQEWKYKATLTDRCLIVGEPESFAVEKGSNCSARGWLR